MYNYGSSSVRKYFGNRYTTFVRKYFRTKVFILSKVLSYEVLSYESTKVLSYFRTFVRKYFRKYESTFEGTKVRKYYVVLSFRTYYSTSTRTANILPPWKVQRVSWMGCVSLPRI